MSFTQILYSSKKSIYEYIEDDGENNVNILLNNVKTERILLIVKSGTLYLKHTLVNLKIKHLTILNPVVNDYKMMDDKCTSGFSLDEVLGPSTNIESIWEHYMQSLHDLYPTKIFYTDDDPTIVNKDILNNFFHSAPSIYIDFYELPMLNRESPYELQDISIKGLNILKCFTNVKVETEISRITNINCKILKAVCSSVSNIFNAKVLQVRTLLDEYTVVNNIKSFFSDETHVKIKNIIEINNARQVICGHMFKLIANNCNRVLHHNTDEVEINGNNCVIHSQASNINSLLSINGNNIKINHIAFYDVNNVSITNKEQYLDHLTNYNYWDNFKINNNDESYIQTMLYKLRNNTITSVNSLYEKLQTKYTTMYAGHVRAENLQYINEETIFLPSNPLYIKEEIVDYLMHLSRSIITKIINNLLSKSNVYTLTNRISQVKYPPWESDLSTHYHHKFIYSTIKNKVVEIIENNKIPYCVIDYKGYERRPFINLKLFTNTRWKEYYASILEEKDVVGIDNVILSGVNKYAVLINNPNKIVDIITNNKRATEDINSIINTLIFFTNELTEDTVIFLYTILNPSNVSILKEFVELTGHIIEKYINNEQIISNITPSIKNMLIRRGILPGNNVSKFNTPLFSSLLTRKILTESKIDITKVKHIKNSITNSKITSYLSWINNKNITPHNIDSDLTKLENQPEWLKCNNYWCENTTDEHSAQKLNQGGYKLRVNAFNFELLQIPLCNTTTESYIVRNQHMGNEINLTVGWVRYDIDRVNKTIWINEIQTDITKLLIKNTIIEMNPIVVALSNKIYNEISLVVIEIFLQWCAIEFSEVEIVAPSAELRTDIIGGSPTVSVYDNNFKKCNFKKQPFNKTIWCTYRNKDSAHIESPVYVYKI